MHLYRNIYKIQTIAIECDTLLLAIYHHFQAVELQSQVQIFLFQRRSQTE